MTPEERRLLLAVARAQYLVITRTFSKDGYVNAMLRELDEAALAVDKP